MNTILIPARGGSKSIKKKNIIDLGSYPMIYYTIYVSKLMKFVDEIIVSTDDDEIREIALSYGVQVPFIRPNAISDDKTGDFEVVHHLISWYKKHRKLFPNNIIYLRPDFPFRKVKTLDKAFEEYNNNLDADGLRSVKACEEIPYKMWDIKDNYLYPFIKNSDVKDPQNSSRQLFPKVYYPIGYIEIFKSDLVITNKTLTSKKMIPFFINNEKYINVGSKKEYEVAKKMIKDFEFIG